MSKEIQKKKYQIDISDFSDLQDAIIDFFLMMGDIINIDDLDIKSIELSIDSNKIIVEGDLCPEETTEVEEEDDDWDWI